MNEVLLEFAGRMADQGASALPESYQQMAANAQLYLKPKMAGSDLGARIGAVSDYRMNLKKGRVTFVFEGGEEISADAQFIGTYSDDGSWMWAWGHPDMPIPMQQAAWAVQQFGERQEIGTLRSRGGPITEEALDQYQAICAYISNADGVFMGPHGAGGQVCVCYYLNDQLKGLLPE